MTNVHDTVAQVWADVLGTPVADDDDFFSLGGHSLLATQMVGMVQRSLGVRLSLRDVLDYSTLGEFTELVSTRSRS